MQHWFVRLARRCACVVMCIAACAALTRGERQAAQCDAASCAAPTIHNDGDISNVTKTYSISRGVYPKGCTWREIRTPGSKHVEYEYWNSEAQIWSSQQPSACYVRGEKPQPGRAWRHSSPRTEMNCSATHCEYTNLWYNNGRWYALVDGPTYVPSWQLSRNQQVSTFHVKDAQAWIESVDFRVVRGDTLLFDFIYFIHPTAIGHWCEMMFPLFSILRRIDFKWPADQFVLLHLKRWHLMEWVRAVVAVTLNVKPHADLPPIILQQETDNIWHQLASPLEGFEAHEWVCFEKVVVVRDMFTGGRRSFQTQEDAQLFRKRIYEHHGLKVPRRGRRGPPRTITFQRKRANRRVVNEKELLDMLATFGKLQVVEFNETNSFEEQLVTMSQTGVYISVHTSNLANSPWLPPGSAVVELIQRYWNWNGLDKSFKEQTQMMGDIHHFAWRALHKNQTVYLNPRDEIRFGHWTNEECFTEECVEAHTNVDVVVDVAEVRALLQSRLPLVFAGKNVRDVEIPWP